MEKLKIVTRSIPETNSSSSHSVCISPTSNTFENPGNKLFNLDIDKDGILRIPKRPIGFGGSWDKFNDVLSKAQYLLGLCYCSPVTNIGKELFLVKSVLKNFTGCKSVILEWEEEYRQKLKEGVKKEDTWIDYPMIDHNSISEMRDLLFSSETIKNFIFNPEIYICTGNDNSDPPQGFYDNEHKSSESIISIDFGGDIGRIDFESDINDYNISEIDLYYKTRDILCNIKIDPTTLKPIVGDVKGGYMLYYFDLIYSYFSGINLIWMSEKVIDTITTTIYRSGGRERDSLLMDLLENQKENFIVYPVSINSSLYGKINYI